MANTVTEHPAIQTLNDLDGLLREMATTNVSQGLKVRVHERWVAQLRQSYEKLRAAVPALLAEQDELREQIKNTEVIEDTVTTIKKRGR